MRNISLIAVREIYQAVTTRAFWVGICILPLMGLMVFGVLRIFQSSGTIKYFVLIDKSGRYETIMEQGLEREYQKEVMRSLRGYIQANLTPAGDDRPAPSLEDIPSALADARREVSDIEADQFISSGGYAAALQSVSHMLRTDAPQFELPRHTYQRVELPQSISTSDEMGVISNKLRPYLNGEQKLVLDGKPATLFAAVLIPESVTASPGVTGPGPSRIVAGSEVQYWSTNLADDGLRNLTERTLTAEIRRDSFMQAGITPEDYRRLANLQLRLKNFNPASAAGKEEVSMADRLRQWVPSGLTYLLWISLFGILNMLLYSTIEEKSNRIIEVLLSSVTADELLLGKLAGIAVVGMIMVGTQMALVLGILFWFAGPEAGFINQLLQVLMSSNLLPVFFAYFLLGYILYGGIFISIGGLCDSHVEAQSFMGPLMLIMMVPMFTIALIPRDPHGPLALAMSWFPLYTPFAMINRIAADPPVFEIIGTLMLLLATSAAILWSAGKIFRIGILRTGQPPKLLEVLKWLRSTESGSKPDSRDASSASAPGAE
jgi:ABC-2 type transport system permease protein